MKDEIRQLEAKLKVLRYCEVCVYERTVGGGLSAGTEYLERSTSDDYLIRAAVMESVVYALVKHNPISLQKVVVLLTPYGIGFESVVRQMLAHGVQEGKYVSLGGDMYALKK